VGYTLGTAAKATGLSKTSILRGIRKGRFSAVKSEDGIAWNIEPSELHRVYPLVPPAKRAVRVTVRSSLRVPEQGNDAQPGTVTLLRERLADKDALIADLREDRDRWRAQAERLALTYQRPNDP
jgi:hypothetical protein